MGPWVEWLGEDPLRPGDRVEVMIGTPTFVLHRGYLVAANDYDMVILSDAWGIDGNPRVQWPKGQPVSFRPDQVRRERTNSEALGIRIRDVEQLLEDRRALYEGKKEPKRLFGLFRRRVTEPRDDTALMALAVSLDALRAAQKALKPNDALPPSCPDEIVTVTADGLKTGDKCHVHIRRENSGGGPSDHTCIFIAEFRDWRFFRFQHGGSWGLLKDQVTPMKQSEGV